MASKAQWDIDPETKSKLAQLSKKAGAGNDKCCDCGAPSPQWASPKFSTFICLTCAGIHRGLGVHVSFVRSISMDTFKQNEILRMQYGGNKAWQDFFNKNSTIPFEETTIKERYDSEIGEEWKERLTAKVEEKEFDREEFIRQRTIIKQKQANKSVTSSGRNTPDLAKKIGNNRSMSPSNSQPQLLSDQKSQNEAYFSKMGEENASRPDHIPPSQGGKYGGFGSSIPETSIESKLPSTNDFQKDPMAALSKGFGWFSSTIGKQAKMVNESYIQPTAKNISSSDFGSQAKNIAFTAGQGIQSGAKGAADSINRFIEGQDEAAKTRSNVEPEKKEFWDNFGIDESNKSNSIGTNIMKKPTGKTKKEDGWGDDW